jgi:DNA-binding NtrC family response regulator
VQIGVEASRAVENKRIFVVDPDEVTRAALQFILHDENETHELPGLEAAYQKARESRPDLILLGISIVQKLGINVIEELKSQYRDLKVVLVAEGAERKMAEEGLKSGADDFLIKPLRVETVRETIDRTLRRVKDEKPLFRIFQ